MKEIKEEGQLQGWQQEAVSEAASYAVEEYARSQHGGRLKNPMESNLWSGAAHKNGQTVWFNVLVHAWPTRTGTRIGVKKLTIFDDEAEFDQARAAFDAQPNDYTHQSGAEVVFPGDKLDFNAI